jgi:hypothetical protein
MASHFQVPEVVCVYIVPSRDHQTAIKFALSTHFHVGFV